MMEQIELNKAVQFMNSKNSLTYFIIREKCCLTTSKHVSSLQLYSFN